MARRKSPPKKFSGYIRVLLAEDNGMARAAWKKVLGKSNQIQVVGEVALSELMRGIANIPLPEVIVAGFSFVEKGLVRSDKLVRVWGYFPKVIVICENGEQVKAAYKSNADWAVAKPFNDQDLVAWVRALSDPKRLCDEHLAELLDLPAGTRHRQQFLQLAHNILHLVFHPDLVNPENAVLTAGPGHHPQSRLVFRNQAKIEDARDDAAASRFNEFWYEARRNLQSKYVPMDIYNSAIDAAAIATMGKYLSASHGRLGLVVGRGEILQELPAMSVALFENEQKVVLLASDAHLRAMLEYKAGGLNPVCLLDDLYQTLIVRAGI